MASPSNVSEIWSGNTSQVLFKGAKATPPPADYERMLQRREEEAEAHPNNDLMRARFWDPSWEHFNANVFKKWDEEYMVEVYQCPFPGCNQVSYTVSGYPQSIRKIHHRVEVRAVFAGTMLIGLGLTCCIAIESNLLTISTTSRWTSTSQITCANPTSKPDGAVHSASRSSRIHQHWSLTAKPRANAKSRRVRSTEIFLRS